MIPRCAPHNHVEPCADCAAKAEYRKAQQATLGAREVDMDTPAVDDRRDESFRENFANKPVVSEG